MAQIINQHKKFLICLENSARFIELVKELIHQEKDFALIHPKTSERVIKEIILANNFDCLISDQSNSEKSNLGEKISKISIFNISDLEFLSNGTIQLASSSKLTFFTSGSIENPTSITFSYEDLLNKAISFAKAFKLKAVEPQLEISLASIGGFNLFLRSEVSNQLIENKTTEYNTSKNSFSGDTNPQKIGSFFPSQIKIKLQQGEDFQDFDIIFIGGEALDESLSQQLKKLKPKIYITYACTEAGGTVAFKDLDSESYQVLPEIELSLVDGQKILLKDDIIGHEIILPDLLDLKDSSTFSNPRRGEREVNSGGFKYSLDALQSYIQSQLEVEVYCVKTHSERWGEGVTCFSKDESLLTKIEGIELEKYQKPKVIIVDEIPMLANRKVDYQKLTSSSKS